MRQSVPFGSPKRSGSCNARSTSAEMRKSFAGKVLAALERTSRCFEMRRRRRPARTSNQVSEKFRCLRNDYRGQGYRSCRTKLSARPGITESSCDQSVRAVHLLRDPLRSRWSARGLSAMRRVRLADLVRRTGSGPARIHCSGPRATHQ